MSFVRQTPAFNNNSLYALSKLTDTISIPITTIGKNLKQTLEMYMAALIDGKCMKQGFIKPGSITMTTFSSGIVNGEYITFDVCFECEVCYPVSGMLLQCECVNVSKAGINSISKTEKPSPFTLFVIRDHSSSTDVFSTIQKGDTFTARVLNTHFELNDTFVSIIGEVSQRNE
jgi:DNA-directed RNA polymerase subunit E'/Rpb7